MASLSSFVIGQDDCTYQAVMNAFLMDPTAKLQIYKEWRVLAHELKIDLVDIEKIHRDEKDGKEVHDLLSTLLVKWTIKESQTANIQTLTDHLVKIEWNHIAENLKKLFPPRKDVSVCETPNEQPKPISTPPQRPKKLEYCFEYLEGYEPKDLFFEVKALMSSILLQKGTVDAMIVQTTTKLKIDANLTAELSLPGMTQTDRFLKLCDTVESSLIDAAKEKTLNLFINLQGLEWYCNDLRNKLQKDFGHIAKIVRKEV